MNYQVKNHQHIFASETLFRQCHASTVCVLPDKNLGAAWFGGEHEKAPDVGIWFFRRVAGEWSEPRKVADREDVPCWNPVLFADGERLLLFYKVGKEIPSWQTFVKESRDSGLTWGEERELVPGDRGGRGPVKNKCIRLQDGGILAPASTEEGGWECFADRSDDGGQTWQRSGNVPLDREALAGSGMIQPTLWQDDQNMVHMLMRSSEGAIYKSDSADGGRSWSRAQKTSLPNNNCGIDLARLGDGRLVLVYNPVSGNWAARSPIAITVSEDNGETWSNPEILDYVPCRANREKAEFSYPAIVACGSDAYITYTWKRKTIAFWQLHFPEKKKPRGLAEGLWPVMLTPFTEQNQVDYEALKELTGWYLAGGAAGLFAVCLSSEMELLTEEERLKIAACVKGAAGDAPVAATAYTFAEDGETVLSAEEQTEAVRRMAGTGADIVVLLTNGLAARDADEECLKTVIRGILEQSPEVSFGLYECPRPYKRMFSPELVKWCAETGRFVFYKETSQSEEQLRKKLEAVSGSGLKLFNADSSLVHAFLKMGGHGYCGVMLNYHPELYAWMMNNWKEDRQTAEAVQQLMTMTAQIEAQCYPRSAKYALGRKGLSIKPCSRRENAGRWNASCSRAVEDMEKFIWNFCQELRRTFPAI